MQPEIKEKHQKYWDELSSDESEHGSSRMEISRSAVDGIIRPKPSAINQLRN